MRKFILAFLSILIIASCKADENSNIFSGQDSEISSPSQEEIDALILDENRKGFLITAGNLPDKPSDSVRVQIESSMVFNSNNTFEAFTFCDDSCQIFYKAVGDEVVNKIDAPYFLKGRPFINIRWPETYILEFEQSSQPNHATSYSVNVQTGELENVQSIYSPPSPQEP